MATCIECGAECGFAAQFCPDCLASRHSAQTASAVSGNSCFRWVLIVLFIAIAAVSGWYGFEAGMNSQQERANLLSLVMLLAGAAALVLFVWNIIWGIRLWYSMGRKNPQ